MRRLQPALDQRQVGGGHRAKLVHASHEASGLQRLDGDVAVGVDANVGGDVERLAHDRLGVERPVGERAGGGERVVAAGADAHDAGLRAPARRRCR